MAPGSGKRKVYALLIYRGLALLAWGNYVAISQLHSAVNVESFASRMMIIYFLHCETLS